MGVRFHNRKRASCKKDLELERVIKARLDKKQFDLSGTDEKGEEDKRYFNLDGSKKY